MMSTGVLETCRELEKIYTKKNCASIYFFTRIDYKLYRFNFGNFTHTKQNLHVPERKGFVFDRVTELFLSHL